MVILLTKTQTIIEIIIVSICRRDNLISAIDKKGSSSSKDAGNLVLCDPSIKIILASLSEKRGLFGLK